MGPLACRPHGAGGRGNPIVPRGLIADLSGCRVAFAAALRCQAVLGYICRPKRRYLGGGKPKAPEQHDYDDIPGTFVFDAERSRQGYGINMFCMSLMKDGNRKAFKANEAAYLKKFNLTPEQTDAILKRDYNRMLELGGNIYFT